MILKILINTLIAFFISFIAFGQCLIHVDKSFYVSGETMHYKLYLSPPMDQNNITIRATIYNKSEEKVHEYFYKNETESFISGYYRIPFGLSSGMYKLVFIATTDKGINTHELASIFFPIYNDLTPIQLTENTVAGSSNNLDDLSIQIYLNRDQINSRSPIQVTIQLMDQSNSPMEADISISVLEQNALNIFPGQNLSLSAEKLVLDGLDNHIYYQGLITDTLGQPLPSKIIGAYSGENQRMLYTKTVRDNLFALKLDDFKGVKPVQFLGSQKEVPFIDVALVKNLGADTEFPDLMVTESILSYLEESRQRKKMAQHFPSMQFPIMLEESKAEQKKLKPDFTYDITKYVDFETIGDFFTELLTPLRFKKDDNGIFTAQMYNPTSRKALNNELTGIPLFIIDGKMTRNADFIAKLKLGKVQTVDLFFKPETIRPTFNILGLSGVAMITTSGLEFDLPPQDEQDVFDLPGLQPLRRNDNNTETLGDKAPFFTPQLFWMANLTTDNQGKASFSFTHSDDLSNYVIQVVARSKNGQYGMAEKFYSVVK